MRVCAAVQAARRGVGLGAGGARRDREPRPAPGAAAAVGAGCASGSRARPSPSRPSPSRRAAAGAAAAAADPARGLQLQPRGAQGRRPAALARRAAGHGARGRRGGELITVAWELSWYRWRVRGETVSEVAKGNEISELPVEDRDWNASRRRGRHAQPWLRRLVVNVDGGARGNPGPAAIAAVVDDAGRASWSRAAAEAIGRGDQQRRRVPGAAARDRARPRARRRRGRAGRRLRAGRQPGQGRVPGQGRRPAPAARAGSRRARGLRPLVDPPRAPRAQRRGRRARQRDPRRRR